MLQDSHNYYSHESAIIDDGAEIGANSKIWHFSHIMSKAKIGQSCVLGQNVFVANNVVLGNNVKVQNNVSIYDGVICEDDVFLGPSMVFTNVYNPRSNVDRKSEFKQTLVKQGASIGANATIVCGVTLGKYSFIGAGTVVKKNVPDYAMVVGVPGVQKGWMSEYGNQMDFSESSIYICPHTDSKYELSNDIVKKI